MNAQRSRRDLDPFAFDGLNAALAHHRECTLRCDFRIVQNSPRRDTRDERSIR